MRLVSLSTFLFIAFSFAPSFGGEALSLPKTYNLSLPGFGSSTLVIDYENKEMGSGFVITLHQGGKATTLPSCYEDLPTDFFEIAAQSLRIKKYHLEDKDKTILEVAYIAQKRGPLTNVENYMCRFLWEDSQFKPVTLERRCGWFMNPTPGNTFLLDAEGEWTIAQQGGHQAKGNPPEFKDDEWINTNNHYGYGCACLMVKANLDKKLITEIWQVQPLSLDHCRRDKKLALPH